MNKIDADNHPEEEHIVYRTGLHKAMFLGPAIIIIIGGISIPSRGISALIILMIGVVWAITSIMNYRASQFTITNDRIIANYGFPWKRKYEIPLTAIEYLDTHQPALGAILNFGKVIIKRKTGLVHSIRMMPKPIEFAKHVQEQINFINNNISTP